MPKKRGFGPERYIEEIMNVLKKEPFMSTAEICNELNMGYETGFKYLKVLFAEKKIKLKKVGNRHFWFV